MVQIRHPQAMGGGSQEPVGRKSNAYSADPTRTVVAEDAALFRPTLAEAGTVRVVDASCACGESEKIERSSSESDITAMLTKAVVLVKE